MDYSEMMVRTLSAISSLLLGIGLLLMGLALLSTALGVRAVSEGYTDITTGFVMASYFGGFILGSYLCPPLIRRIGPIRTFTALAAIASVSSFLPTLLVHPLFWAMLRFSIGMCVVGLYMVIESWLNNIAPNTQRGQILAVYMTVTLAAHAFGQFLLLLDPHAQGIAFGIAALFFSLGLVPVALTRLPEPQPVAIPVLHLKHLYHLSPLSVIGSLTGGLVTSCFWALGAVFAYRSGMNGIQIVIFMAVTISGGVMLQMPIGRLSDHVDRRIILLVVTVLATLVALLAVHLSQGELIWFYIGMFLLGGLIFPIYGLSVAYLNDRVHSQDALEASRGLLLMYGVGALSGPVLAGIVMHLFGARSIFYYMVAVLAGFTIFALIRIRETAPIPVAERSTFMPMTRTSQAVLEMDPRLPHNHVLPLTK